MIQAAESALGDFYKSLLTSQANENDRIRLNGALQLAIDIYGEERRPSGETYLEHGRNVAMALSELGIEDIDTIIAALLHDTLQPFTRLTGQDLEKRLGREVTALIKGAKTIDDYSKRASRNRPPAGIDLDSSLDKDTLEAIRKALLSIIEGDIRIIVIRMVD